jgi:hypothetical protein
MQVLKTRQVNHPQLSFVHQVNKCPKCQLCIFYVIKNHTDDKVHSLNVADLGVVDCVLGENLFEHLLEAGVIREGEAFGMGAEEVFVDLGLLGFLDLF